MKKYTGIILILLLLIGLSACKDGDNFGENAPSYSSSEVSVPEENPESLTAGSQASDLASEEWLETPSVLFETLDDAVGILQGENAEEYKEGAFAELFNSVRQKGYIYAPAIQNGVTWGSGWNAAFKAKSGMQASGIRYRVRYNETTALVYIAYMAEAEGKLASADLANAYNGVVGQKSQAETVSHKLLFSGKETAAYGTAVQNGLKYTIWFMLDDTHLVSVEWFSPDAKAAEEFVSKLEFEKVELKTGKPTLPSTPITPEAGITPPVTPPVGEIVPNA